MTAYLLPAALMIGGVVVLAVLIHRGKALAQKEYWKDEESSEAILAWNTMRALERDLFTKVD
jgi:hypothetical protein